MADVMDLAESVWRTDPRATNHTPDLAPVYSVPVDDHEGSDLRRIVTQEIEGRQVDFYQFYWADLMEGNRFVFLWTWFRDLMARKPNEIPQAIWPIRQITMAIALIIGIWGVVLGRAIAAPDLSLPPPAQSIWLATWALVGLYLSWAGWRTQTRPPPVANRDQAERAGRTRAILITVALLVIGAAVIGATGGEPDTARIGYGSGLLLVGAVLAWIYARASRTPPAAWAKADIARAAAGWAIPLAALGVGGVGVKLLGTGGAYDLSLTEACRGAVLALATLSLFQLPFSWRRSAVFSLGLILIVLSLAMAAAGPPHGATSPWIDASLVLVLLLALAGWWLSKTFLIPVMTDSARMFSDSPVNIPNQNRIRERGLKLLRQLHDRRRERAYDRIVILAHSLGTVVAYRLLAHYWGNVVDRLEPNAAMRAAGDAVEDAAERLAAGTADVANWREAVRAYGETMRDPDRFDRPWLISDFVTIGSPLTYASLLMEKSQKDFDEQVRLYKRYPTAPPQPRTPGASGFTEFGRPHHAAMFAATNWTNLFYPPRWPVGGDLVGGPIASAPPGGLGPGVLDVSLAHDLTVEGFAHNSYWRLQVGREGEVSPLRGAPAAPHIAALRDALHLFDDGPNAGQGAWAAAERNLMRPVETYKNP